MQSPIKATVDVNLGGHKPPPSIDLTPALPALLNDAMFDARDAVENLVKLAKSSADPENVIEVRAAACKLIELAGKLDHAARRINLFANDDIWDALFFPEYLVKILAPEEVTA